MGASLTESTLACARLAYGCGDCVLMLAAFIFSLAKYLMFKLVHLRIYDTFIKIGKGVGISPLNL